MTICTYMVLGSDTAWLVFAPHTFSSLTTTLTEVRKSRVSIQNKADTDSYTFALECLYIDMCISVCIYWMKFCLFYRFR